MRHSGRHCFSISFTRLCSFCVFLGSCAKAWKATVEVRGYSPQLQEDMERLLTWSAAARMRVVQRFVSIEVCLELSHLIVKVHELVGTLHHVLDIPQLHSKFCIMRSTC